MFSGIQDRLGHVQGEFSFLRCLRCGSIVLHPFPKDEDLESFYPESYRVRRPSSDENLASKLQSVIWKMLFLPVYRSDVKAVMQMTGMEKGRLLEIGCSSGYHLREFVERGEYEIHGLDVDKHAVDHARKDLGPHIRNIPLHAADFPSNTFDIVILFNVLEHLVKPAEMLREVRRILKGGGYLVIKTQFIDSLQGRIFGSRWMIVNEAPRHVLLPSAEGMRALFHRTGFETANRKPASLLENSVHVALSILPGATENIAFGSDRGLNGYLRRLVGCGIGLAAIPYALIERMCGRSGTMIYLGQKQDEPDLDTVRSFRKALGVP
jgi:SAM-dependent methyltransferase